MAIAINTTILNCLSSKCVIALEYRHQRQIIDPQIARHPRILMSRTSHRQRKFHTRIRLQRPHRIRHIPHKLPEFIRLHYRLQNNLPTHSNPQHTIVLGRLRPRIAREQAHRIALAGTQRQGLQDATDGASRGSGEAHKVATAHGHLVLGRGDDEHLVEAAFVGFEGPARGAELAGRPDDLFEFAVDDHVADVFAGGRDFRGAGGGVGLALLDGGGEAGGGFG